MEGFVVGAERADGPAAILAIGTANPANAVNQMEYPDYYFRITNADDRPHLKNKFKRICNYYVLLNWLATLLAPS